MNEIRVSARAVFDPGTKKPTSVQTTAKAVVNSFAHGAPKVTVKASQVKAPATKPAVFDPGVAKAAPVRTIAKAKVKVVNRVTAKATAKPWNYVVRQKAKSRVGAVIVSGVLGRPHDNKTAISKATHDPAVTAQRNYKTTGRAISGVTYLRPLQPHDRKTATSKAVFGTFTSRPPVFRWS